MNPNDAIKEVQRCADALTKALNAAAEQGLKLDIEVLERSQAGQHPAGRQVVVQHHEPDTGIRPQDLNSTNDY
ncbi:hypothetical protein [Fulvimarina sp. MAC8]|uniref:hypothetical protein n=1 Tax=Fulvimarina sp. MAC8 TaxID=3162874 RepID=UPI0032EF65DB